jgi:hypothetical protein
MTRVAAVFGNVVALAALLAACRGTGSTDDSRTSSAPRGSAAPDALPVDHLAPGEVVEGREEAFGIRLPQGIRIDETFARVVFASGPLTVHPIVQYFRSRLHDGDVREGETSATFEHVTAPGKPDRSLTIHIAEVRRATTIEIRDATPPPSPNLPDETARWKNVGLTPNGRILDPTHLE